METDEEREARLKHMSHLKKLRMSLETDEERATRLSAAQQRPAEIRWDGHLPLLEQHDVQATMRSFHQDMATIESPMCSTCMEKFPGLKISARTSECLRCARDKTFFG